ncbi:MAG: sugar transferase, partial [Candidatus Acidiferrum sp.]
STVQNTLESSPLIARFLGFPSAHDRADLGGRYLMFFDLMFIWLSAGLAGSLAILYSNVEPDAGQHFDSALWGLLFLFSVLVVLFANSTGVYRNFWKRGLKEEITSLGGALVSASVVVAVVDCFKTVRVGSPWAAGMTLVLSFGALVAWRRFLRVQAIPGLTEKRNALIVGGGRMAVALQTMLNENPELGYVVKGFVNTRSRERTDRKKYEGLPPAFLGNIADIPKIIREQFIDEIFICVPSNRELVMEVASYTNEFRIHLRVVPDLYDGLAMGAPVEYFGELPTITLQRRTIPTLGLIFKRLIDIAASLLGLMVLSPVLLLAALLVKLDSKGPVLYSSFRVGRKGQTFRCHKFRTMVVNAEAIKDSLRHLNERNAVTFKIDDDPRITRLGRFLRKYSLDELPQLWNVLRGDLSLVGPRPHPLDDYSRYALEHRQRLEVKPGITGLWQVSARRDPSFEKNVALDAEYIQKWSLWLDLRILWKTFAVVLAGTGQ